MYRNAASPCMLVWASMNGMFEPTKGEDYLHLPIVPTESPG